MDTTVACPRWPVTLNPSLFLLSLIQASLLESVTKGDRLYVEVLQAWALDISLCPVDWRWLWNPELGLNLLLSQTPQSLPHSFPDVFNASPLTMSSLTAPSIPVHTATANSHPQWTCPICVCVLCGERGHVGTHCPTSAAESIPSTPA